MKKVFLPLAISAVLVISGCAYFEPTVFDVPQSHWNTLTPEQKQEAIKGYNERKNTEAQLAPVKQAIGVADQYLQNKHTEESFKDSHNTNTTNNSSSSTSSSKKVVSYCAKSTGVGCDMWRYVSNQ